MVYLVNKTGLIGMGEENERKSDILFQDFSYTIYALTISWATKLREQSWATLSMMGIWLCFTFSGEKQCSHELFVNCACDVYLVPFHLFSHYLYKHVRDIYFIA